MKPAVRVWSVHCGCGLLNSMRGRIHIEETDGGGATFVISLPFYPPPVSDDQLMK